MELMSEVRASVEMVVENPASGCCIPERIGQRASNAAETIRTKYERGPLTWLWEGHWYFGQGIGSKVLFHWVE